MFSVAFGFKGFETARLIIELLEILFFIEIIQLFLTAYKDTETFESVYSVKRIAIHYILNGPFLLNFLAAFPY